MPVTLTRIHHTGFIVSSLNQFMLFYNRLLGIEPKLLGHVHNNPAFDA